MPSKGASRRFGAECAGRWQWRHGPRHSSATGLIAFCHPHRDPCVPGGQDSGSIFELGFRRCWHPEAGEEIWRRHSQRCGAPLSREDVSGLPELARKALVPDGVHARTAAAQKHPLRGSGLMALDWLPEHTLSQVSCRTASRRGGPHG